MDDKEADKLLRKLFPKTFERPKFLVLDDMVPHKKVILIRANFVDIDLALSPKEWTNLISGIHVIKNRKDFPKDVDGYWGIDISRNKVLYDTLGASLAKTSKEYRSTRFYRQDKRLVADTRTHGLSGKVLLRKSDVEIEIRRKEFLELCDFILEYQSGKHRHD